MECLLIALKVEGSSQKVTLPNDSGQNLTEVLQGTQKVDGIGQKVSRLQLKLTDAYSKSPGPTKVNGR